MRKPSSILPRVVLPLLLVASFFRVRATQGNTQKRTSRPEVWLNVFVHGIMSLRPHLNVGNLVKVWRDTVPGSKYEKAVHHIRRNKFFYQSQPLQGMGLHPVDMSSGNKSAVSVIAKIYDSFLTRYADHQTKHHFYTFGWLGALSATLRYDDNVLLHAALLKEIKKFIARGIRPKLRLIGYSHGANICLELPLTEECGDATEPLVVDDLWLIGMPVQEESDYLINRPMFKKVWHFYSYGDHIQKLDSISFRRFFSGQTFCERFGFKPSNKLTQVRLKVTSFQHTCGPNDEYTEEPINLDPGHIELWSFGWSPSSYRQKFPFRPLPVMIFLPIITHYISQDDKLIKEVIVDVQPEKGNMVIRNKARTRHRRRRNCVYETTVPFLPPQEFEQMRKHAQLLEPKNYTRKNYDKHIRAAKLKALAEHKRAWRACKDGVSLEDVPQP